MALGKKMFTIACIMALGAGALGAQVKLRVGGTDAPPYRILAAGERSGIYVEIMDEVAKQLGITVEYTEMPMARALGSMQSGTIDLMLGPNKTVEREAFMSFLVEVPFPREDKGLYRKAGAEPIRSYSDLGGKTIGVLKGAAYDKRFDADTELRKVEINDYLAGLKMVESGRLDALIMPDQQAGWLLKREGLALSRSDLTFGGNESYIAISKASAQAMAQSGRIVEAMRKLKASGVIDRIIAKYKG